MSTAHKCNCNEEMLRIMQRWRDTELLNVHADDRRKLKKIANKYIPEIERQCRKQKP